MKKPRAEEEVLFIGNGINNINNFESWSELIEKLKAAVSKPEDVELIAQFPLVFESILNFGIRNGKINNELELKNIVASNVSKLELNEIHERIDKICPRHIITTNYDSTLENGGAFENDSVVKEIRFSLFRRHTSTTTNRHIWYIHGESAKPASINLGFEHYGGQLQQLRTYIIYGKKYEKAKRTFEPLVKRLDTISHQPDSWIDLFFLSNIHIIGLSLDYIEIDIWWLLSYRAKLLTQKRKRIKNSIYYYVPIKFVERTKGKLELFRNLGVNVRIVEGEDVEYYNKVLDIVEGKADYNSQKSRIKNLLSKWIDIIID